jgi:ribose transport system substrate-binding protein
MRWVARSKLALLVPQTAMKDGKTRTFRARCGLWITALALFCEGCHSGIPFTIAVIPRTSGTGLWEPEHAGAEEAAVRANTHIYWNAPTREDDVEGQIALVSQVASRGYQGLVLAPDQALSLIAPVRKALAHGVPTVIVGSPLPLPAGEKLSYILNDDEAAGRIAAERVAELLQGHGFVAVLGINPDISAVMIRARSLEVFLGENYPDIHLIKRMGSFNFLHEHQVAEEMLKDYPEIRVIVAMMWASGRAAISAIGETSGCRAKVVAFDPDGGLPFDDPAMDSAIAPDMRSMGRLAVQLIDGERHGRAMPPLIKLQPIVITRQNVNTPEIRHLLSMEWRPTPWVWSTPR